MSISKEVCPAFIFPSDYFNTNKPDEIFKDQALAIVNNGFNVYCLNISEILSLDHLPFNLDNKFIIYRGWMLDEFKYRKLNSLVIDANGRLFISPKEYLLAHHLPNWYGYIEKFSPKTKVFPCDENLQANLLNIGWNKFFIKDYVKSLKTSVGSIIEDIQSIPIFIEEMKKYRGEIEGGICIREFEEYLPDTEVRFFAIKGIPFGPHEFEPIPNIVYECCKRIHHPFFSIDVIKTKDYKDRIVEIGDGQVSDYVGWDLIRFISILKYLI